MNRVAKLLDKKISKPHNFTELKQNPFPFLSQCNRLQIFQFIYQLQEQNANLKKQLRQLYPERTFEQLLQEGKTIKLKKRMIQIQQESVNKIEVEIKNKMMEQESLRVKNQELGKMSKAMESDVMEIQEKLIEFQKIKKELQLKVKLERERTANVDFSQIFKNLYQDVKNVLDQ